MKYKYIVVYCLFFLLLSSQFNYEQMLSISLHTSVITYEFLYFICNVYLWGRIYYGIIDNYQQLDIFIRIRMSHLHYVIKTILPLIIIHMIYFLIMSSLFFITFQHIPIFYIFINIIIYSFSTLFVLLAFHTKKYNFIIMLCVILICHLMIL